MLNGLVYIIMLKLSCAMQIINLYNVIVFQIVFILYN